MFNKKGFLILCLAATASFSHAGSVITTNLSAGVEAIVNIDGAADGASNWTNTGNYSQDYWQNPFNINGHLTELTLGAGTYSFTLVNPTDALAYNPGLTSAQQSQLYTAWTYNSPWVTDYFAWDAATASQGANDLFAGAVSGQIPNLLSYPGASNAGFDNATDAYNAAKTSGIGSKIWLGGRFSGPEESTYTLTQTTTLIFAIPDYDVYDNAGGVSVMVQSVPEPANLLLLAPAALFLLRRPKQS